MSLALRYRPHTFKDLAGQAPVQLVLFRMLHNKDGEPLDPPEISTALLFTGGRGSGKTSTARIVAAALNCTEPGRRPCTKCASCEAIQDGRPTDDVLEIDAASTGGVTEIRKLKERTAYIPVSPYRVIIIDEAHSMSRDAFNALLKVLEEPPERTCFILITTERTKILDTVASRCEEYRFRYIPRDVISERLRLICNLEGLAADDELLDVIADRAQGGLRNAIMELDQVTRVGISTLRHYEVLMGEHDYAPSLVEAAATGDAGKLFARSEVVLAQIGDTWAISAALSACLRDLLVISTGGSCGARGESLRARQALAARIPDDRVAAAIRVLWDLRCRGGGEHRSSLDMALFMCMEKLHPRTSAPKGTNGNGHGPMGVDEMRRLAAL